MKRLLSIIMCIVLTLVFAACGSEDLGTKGMAEGHLYKVEWSKAMFGSTIKMTVTGNLGVDDTWEETKLSTSYDEQQYPDVSAFSIDKKITAKKVVYTIKPVAGALNQVETDKITTEVMIKDIKAKNTAEEEAENNDLTLMLELSTSDQQPISVAVKGLFEGIVYEDLGLEGNYAVGVNTDGNIDGSLSIALDNRWGSIWTLGEYDTKMISCTEKGVNAVEDKAVFVIDGLKAGDTKLPINNKSRGMGYIFSLHIEDVSVGDIELEADGVASEAVKMPSSFKVTVTGTEKVEKPAKISDVEGYETIKADEELAVDIDNDIKLPGEAHVQDVYTVDATNDGYGKDGVETVMVVNDNEWRYFVNAATGISQMEDFYGFNAMEAKGIDLQKKQFEIKGVTVDCYSVENNVICLWQIGRLTHTMEGIELNVAITEDEIKDMLNKMI